MLDNFDVRAVIRLWADAIDPARARAGPSSSLSNMKDMILRARRIREAERRVALPSATRPIEDATHPSGISFRPHPGAGSRMNVNLTGSLTFVRPVNR